MNALKQCVSKMAGNYVSLEHADQAANPHGSRICRLTHVCGRQIPQLVSQKPQINHCLGGLGHCHLPNKFVNILSKVPQEVLRGEKIET